MTHGWKVCRRMVSNYNVERPLFQLNGRYASSTANGSPHKQGRPLNRCTQ